MRRPLDRSVNAAAGPGRCSRCCSSCSARSAKASDVACRRCRRSTPRPAARCWNVEAGAEGSSTSCLRRWPLDFCKDQMLVLGSSQNGRFEAELNAHEHCSLLRPGSAGPSAKKVNGRMISSISVDQAAAKAVGDQTYLPLLEIGLSNNETKYCSAQPMPPQYEPNPRIARLRPHVSAPHAVVSPNWRNRRRAARPGQ